jgi:long-chain acyl-CoA synthetase
MSEPQTLPDLLRSQAERLGDSPLVTWWDGSFTYAEFNERTDALAAGLAGLGVKPGDVVSVFLPNSPAFLEAWWAILKAGGVFGPVNPALTGAEAQFVVEHSEAVAIVTDAAGAEKLAGRELPGLRHVIGIDGAGDVSLDDLRGRGGEVPEHGREPDDLAAILYTSGTTGQPKGAMLTHRNYLVDCAVGAELLPLVEGERVGMMLPLFHANAQVVTFMVPIMIGAEVIMWERFSASTFWQTIDEYKPVTISAVPTILATIVDAPGAPTGPTSLRYVVCGAAPLSRELLETFETRLDIRILEGYGMTETTCISSINPFYGARKPGSIGLPVRRQEMRIVDEDGNDVAAGERGEIVMRGPMVMPGYLKNPEANEATIRDGWLHSGDIGYVDEDGYFFIVDRTKDMIIRGGENIYPREIEEVLYQHADVLECAVIGLPDKVRGEEVLAVVAARADATLDADELKEFAAERLAKYKVPRQIEIRDELPKTPTGKIQKAPLREEFGGIWETTASTAADS